MGAVDTLAALVAFERRGAGTDAERRAARWLSRELPTNTRDAVLETFWCRPNWALAHAWHVTLGLAGSLVSIASPLVGGALLLVGLVSLTFDALGGRSLGRRLTPERASQNVVSRAGGAGLPVRLIVTANYDAGRTGLLYRDQARRLASGLRRIAGDGALAPGWLGWLAIGFVWLIIIALLRADGASGTAIGVAQLIPTAALVLTLALLLELTVSDYGPGAGDNASGVGLAVAIIRALDVSPLRRLSVDLVLQGAGENGMIGLRRYLRARRGELEPGNVIVLGVAPCAAGTPRWWSSDGSLVPLHYHRRLIEIASRVAGPQTDLGAVSRRGRGITAALPGRVAGLPAITIGCLDAQGLVPRSHQTGDVPEAVDRSSIDRLLELALTLVDAIDADLERTAQTSPVQPAAAPGAEQPAAPRYL